MCISDSSDGERHVRGSLVDAVAAALAGGDHALEDRAGSRVDLGQMCIRDSVHADDIALLEHPGTRDAVDDLVIYGHAHAGGIAVVV